jgi:hypothetical protein
MTMDDLKIEVCPETGICSIVRSGTDKMDLMPNEVAAIRDAGAEANDIRAVLAEANASFAESLSEAELQNIAGSVG